MFEQVDEASLVFGRSLGRYPVAQRLQSMLLENSVGVFAEAFDQVLKPAFVCMIDS